MIIKDIIFALRNIGRKKLLTVINVLGLATGVTACLVIFLIAAYELSVDRGVPGRDRIYRMYSSFSGVFTGTNPGVPTGVADFVRDRFTGIDALTNFHTWSAHVSIPTGGKDLDEHRDIVLADPEYFHVFTHYKWVVGDPHASLSKPFQVVLTESRARTYFGDIDMRTIPGMEVVYDDSLRVTVSGIVEDLTGPTDLSFTDFISLSTAEKSWLNGNIMEPDNWTNVNSACQVFIKLSPGSTFANVEQQMGLLGEKVREFEENGGFSNVLKLQPFPQIHFGTELGIFDSSRSVMERSTIDILVTVAILLLVIAVVNFVNLETAQGALRAKEVGVRKVLGSSRVNLITRFLVESFVLTFFAVVIAAALAPLVFGWFKEFIPEGLVFRFSDPLVWAFLGGCLVTVTLLAGLYPAFILSSYQPALALKNVSAVSPSTTRSAALRQVLTVFQFTVAQILVIATVVMALQLDFMVNKELGFAREGIVNVHTPWMGTVAQREVFRNELEKIPGIERVSLQNQAPSAPGYNSRVMDFDNGQEVVKHNVLVKWADTSYVDLYSITLLAGRNFVPQDEPGECIINETYMRQLGFANPHDALGKVVGEKYTIVGVAADFHARSLHHAIEPTAVYYSLKGSSVGIKLPVDGRRLRDMKETIDQIGAAFKTVYPDATFEYAFLDDAIRRFYENEQRTGKLARAATGVAILVSCLGLFGLSTFTVIQRTKEIGIRKVLGATVSSILILLSRDFMKLVILAFLLAAPLAWYVSEWWLKDFVYKMSLSVWIFPACAAFSVLIAFATIGFRALRAAAANPVETLRYE